jgi:hypothetical protein
LRLPKSLRESLADIFEEGAESCQSLITGLSDVASVLFEGVQEAGHDIGIKVVEADLSDFLPAGCRDELQQEPHRICVAGYGVRPKSFLELQVVVKEGREDRPQWRCT